MTDRERATTTDTVAECRTCGWTDTAAGARGRGALHHDRSGHEVRVTVTTVTTYGNREATLAEQGQQRLEGVA